jgi:hypothetical protein
MTKENKKKVFFLFFVLHNTTHFSLILEFSSCIFEYLSK